jgi:hypothetical protein
MGLFVIRDWVFICSVNREWSQILFVIRKFSINVIRDIFVAYYLFCEL